MTSLFPAQRAAEEFDKALGGTATRAVEERYAELLDMVVLLREQPEVTPRAEFVGDLRSRLMTAAETQLVAAPSVVRDLASARSTRNRRRIGTVAASLVIVGGTAGMAAAASGALPGESLYPVKRGVEQASTAIRFGDVSKGNALLDQASTRLDEVRALQAQGNPDTDLISSTLDSFTSAANAGSEKMFQAYQSSGDTQDITTVRTFTAQQMGQVATLSGLTSSIDGLVGAADTLADIDQQARVLCGACDPRTQLTTPPALSAGAGAATVANLLSRPVTQARRDIAQAHTQAEAARVARLQAAAEEAAGKLPKTPAGTGLGSTPGAPSVTEPEAPVTSTITKDGDLVPSITTGAAVKDLVSGVTGSVDGLTTKLAAPKTKTPLDGAVNGLTGALDGATKNLLP
jgi:hypothetical protein